MWNKSSKPTDFLKEGNDAEFDKAMNSINVMYDDLFKTTDYNPNCFDNENLGKFDSIENMWNDIMDIKPEPIRPSLVELE
jgi:hypothetical protein